MVPPLSRQGVDEVRIFISGPYTMGDVAVNVRRAIDAAHAVREKGHAVFLPHLTHFWHLVHPRPWQDWMDLDREWLSLCHAILRLNGESVGADREVSEAMRMGLRLYRSVEEVPLFGERH